VKGEIYLESAVYRVVDTETMQIVYIGFTRYLDVSTIRNVRLGYNHDGKYVLDYIPEQEWREKCRYFAEYQPVFGKPSTFMKSNHDLRPLTEKERKAWIPFNSNERMITILNILFRLQEADRYRKHYLPFELYLTNNHCQYMRFNSKEFPSEYKEIMNDIRQNFCQLVNENYEKSRDKVDMQ